jgi:nucleotide-binding universal stress UspA family protein
MEYNMTTVPTTIAPPTGRVTAAPRVGRPLMVAITGGSAPAIVAAAQAAAARLGGIPQVVTVREPVPLYLPDAGVLPLHPDVEAEQLRRQLDDVTRALRLVANDAATWPVVVVEGQPARTIAQLARERRARLIVLGIGRHAPVDRLFGSETALQTIRMADRPVLAVAPDFAGLPRRAVAAVDFSPASVRAAEEALALLADGGTLTLVHVRPHYEDLVRPDEAWDLDHDQRVGVLFQRLIAGLEPRPSVTVTTVVESGDPAGQVLAVAEREGAELIASGSSGLGFFERLIVGSVATRILRRATVSVLAVPRPSAAEAELIERQLASRVKVPESTRLTALLEAFSQRNAGRPTQLEIDDPALGARRPDSGHPLLGVSYDQREGRLSLTLGAPGGGTLTHSISGVTSVAVLADPHRRDLALQAKHGRGQTILTFLDSAD